MVRLKRHDPPAPDDIQLLTKAQIADALRVSRNSVLNYVRRGVLAPPLRLTSASPRWTLNALREAQQKLMAEAKERQRQHQSMQEGGNG